MAARISPRCFHLLIAALDVQEAAVTRTALLACFMLLAACGDAAGADTISRRDASAASAWEIGPIIAGRNYSQGVPLHPSQGANGSWSIELPRAPGGIHYVTFPYGPLTGKRRILIRYRIDAAQGVRILPVTGPDLPSIITLYFQRSGDNWTGRGRYEAYRWYATFASQSPITSGEHVMIAPLDGNWTAVETSSARTSRTAFRDALAHADRVGFVLGGGDGYGHGVFATGPARLVVTDFRVE
jgi:hypothetical protein